MATAFERLQEKRKKAGQPESMARTNEQSAATAQRNASLGFGTISTPQGSTQSTYTSTTKPNTINFTTAGPTQTGAPVATTPRPITPAPVSNTGVQSPQQAENPEVGVYAKLLKAQYGDTLTDAEYQVLAQKQLSNGQAQVDSAKAAQDAILAKQRENIVAEEARVKAREEELKKTTEGRVQLYKEQQTAMAAPEKQRAELAYNENLATSERLLGARGNLTSAVGYQNARDLNDAKVATLNATDARVAAQVALYQASLEEADSETLRALQDNVNKLYAAEQTAILDAETNLQNLKLTAQQAGDQALMDLVASAQSSLDKKKVESSYSKDLTESIGDGYLYGVDAKGNPTRLKDSAGNEFKAAGGVGKDRYMSVDGNVFDMSTGEYVSGTQKATSSSGDSTNSTIPSGGFDTFNVSSTETTPTGSTPISTTVEETITIPNTFAEYLDQKQNEAGQTFGDSKRKELEKEYTLLKSKPTPKAQTVATKDLSKYDWAVQQVIKGVVGADSLLTGGTVGERAKYKAQLAQADKEGLLKPAPTEKQKTVLNTIISQYNKSPLIAASDRTVTLKNAISAVEKEPDNGTLQLNLVYSYIQALDTYQSAVREGELGLVNSIDSTIGKYDNTIQKIKNGQIVRPEQAKQIASAAKNVLNTIAEAAKAKEKSFASQARVNGIGDLWTDFQGGYESSFETPAQSDNSYKGFTLPY